MKILYKHYPLLPPILSDFFVRLLELYRKGKIPKYKFLKIPLSQVPVERLVENPLIYP